MYEKKEVALGQIKKNCKELSMIAVLDKIQEYRRNFLQHINLMSCNVRRLLRTIKN